MDFEIDEEMLDSRAIHAMNEAVDLGFDSRKWIAVAINRFAELSSREQRKAVLSRSVSYLEDLLTSMRGVDRSALTLAQRRQHEIALRDAEEDFKRWVKALDEID